ncbi:15403_t:CDS:2, partial [Entrophospora sp. SA101]
MNIQSEGSDSRRRKEPNEMMKKDYKKNTQKKGKYTVPKLRSELSRSLRTPQTRRTKKTPQTEQLNADTRSTAMYCKASTNGRSFPIIINSGAAGKVDDLPLTIGGITIPLSAIHLEHFDHCQVPHYCHSCIHKQNLYLYIQPNS